MVNELKIHGHSDDLIEVEGAVRHEFYATYGERDTIRVSPGYVFEVEYGNDGEWTIDMIETPEDANYEIASVGAAHEYSQVLRINHPGENYTVEMEDSD